MITSTLSWFGRASKTPVAGLPCRTWVLTLTRNSSHFTLNSSRSLLFHVGSLIYMPIQQHPCVSLDGALALQNFFRYWTLHGIDVNTAYKIQYSSNLTTMACSHLTSLPVSEVQFSLKLHTTIGRFCGQSSAIDLWRRFQSNKNRQLTTVAKFFCGASTTQLRFLFLKLASFLSWNLLSMHILNPHIPET